MSKSYLDTYADGGIYDDSQYGGPLISRGITFARFMKDRIPPKSKIICIGCGLGYEVLEYLNQGHDAYGTELHKVEDVKPLEGRIIKAVVPHLPFKDKQFYLLHCTEVLEHIEPDETDAFLKECKRVSEIQFFSIATVMDSFQTHINLQTPGWWLQRFEQNKFDIQNFQYKPIVINNFNGHPFGCCYPDGITIYANSHY